MAEAISFFVEEVRNQIPLDTTKEAIGNAFMILTGRSAGQQMKMVMSDRSERFFSQLWEAELHARECKELGIRQKFGVFSHSVEGEKSVLKLLQVI